MALFSKDDLLAVIKYEGDNNTLVWKHPREDYTLGSQLIVHESQEAVFFRDGQALDLFGPGRYTLETQKLPLLGALYRLPTGGDEPFHSEVYFVNQTTQMGVKWGTDSKVRLFDPASGLHIEIGASGEFNIRVTDSRRLLVKVVGTADSLGQNELLGTGGGHGIIRALVMTQVKSYLAQTIKESGINILEIDERLMDLSTALRDKINAGIQDYGLDLPEFFVSRIVTPDDDPNYRKLKDQFAQQHLLVREEQIRKIEAEAAAERKAVEAETQARMKMISARGDAEALKIQKAAEAEAHVMQAEAEAAEMRMKGFTYQQETARQVGLEAMKNGIAGSGGGGGGIGEIAGLGVALGAMGGLAGMTREAMEPLFGAPASAPAGDLWDCTCGKKGIASRFCPECGSPRPSAGSADVWDCACGAKNITSKFCPECGRKHPEPSPGWDCACGKKGITSKFCPECGAKRPEAPETWDCSCGHTGNRGAFCEECGKRKEPDQQ